MNASLVRRAASPLKSALVRTPGCNPVRNNTAVDWAGWAQMPVPSQTTIAVQAIIASPTAAQGAWAGSLDPAVDLCGLIISVVTPGGLIFGIWTPAESTLPVPAEIPSLHRWHGPGCPAAVLAALALGAPIVTTELAPALVAWGRLGWPAPGNWLDAGVHLAMENRSAEWPEVAAWLAGATPCALVERPLQDPSLSATLNRWSLVKHWSGVQPKRGFTATGVLGGLLLVRVSLGVIARTGLGQLTAREAIAWRYDQILNVRGLPIDRHLGKSLVALGPALGIDNPFPKVQEVLRHLAWDERVYGAYHFRGQFTGRWGSSKPCLHNLRKPRLSTKLLRVVIRLVRQGHGRSLLRHRSAQDAADLLGNLERCIVATPPGMSFIVADQGQAEPRCLFTAAGLVRVVEIMDRVDLYLHPDLQKPLFGDVVPSTHPDAKRRRLCLKIAIIACGYGMAAETLLSYAVDTFGFDLQSAGVDPSALVDLYRSTFSQVPRLWRQMGDASVAAVGSRTPVPVPLGTFTMVGSDLHLVLLSGRAIVYPEACVVRGRYNNAVLGYRRGGPLRGRLETAWGGTLTQNAVTGSMRDVHAGHLVQMQRDGLDPCGHTHDDAICLVTDERVEYSIDQMTAIMGRAPDWMSTLRLRVEAYATKRLGGEGLPA